MSRIANHKTNILLFGKFYGCDNVLGVGDSHGVGDVVAQLTGGVSWRERVTTLVGKDLADNGRRRLDA